MSRLDDLLTTLCPDGIPFMRIGSCCIIEKGHTPIQKAIPGNYPLVVTTSERKTSKTFQFDKPGVCIPLVSSRGHGVASLNEVFYQEGQYAVGNILCCVIPINPNALSAKFLHIYLNYAKDILLVPQMKGGANVSLSIDAISRVKIPVPPIEVQQEIVRILDSFTALTAELQTELQARKKQYEYYRDILLNQNKDTKLLPLSKTANVFRGEYITKKDTTVGNIPVILGGQEPAYYINKFNHKGEIVVVARSGASAGFVSYWNEPIFITDGFGFEACTDIVTPKYLYYALKRKESELNAMKRGAGVPHVSGEMLNKVELPIPSLVKQNEIVELLDNFNTICNDLNTGLPAEIAARQKQYEYYRDKLLTFQEKKGA